MVREDEGGREALIERLRVGLADAGIISQHIDRFFAICHSDQAISKFTIEKIIGLIKTQQELLSNIEKQLVNIGVPQERVSVFLAINHPIATLKKLNQHLPTREEWEKYKNLPRDFKSLAEVRLPILCGWSEEQLIEVLNPTILKHTKKYHTSRCDISDCKQNGAIGILRALKTDAGIAPFASHAYSRIRTSIRRPSAQSGVIAMPEKRPSRDEVRIQMTIWLSGKYRDYLKSRVINKHLAKLGVSDMASVPSAEQDRVKTDIDKVLKSCKFDIPTQSYLSDSDVEEKTVQRTGKGNSIREQMIVMNYKLDNLPIEVRSEFQKFLGIKFGVSIHHDKVLGQKSIMDGDFSTVKEMVEKIACPPDFHGNPASLDVGIDNDDSKHSITSSESYLDTSTYTSYFNPKTGQVEQRLTQPNERIKRRIDDPSEAAAESELFLYKRKLVNSAKAKIRETLSPKQLVVFDKMYGEDPISGTELAKNFGQYTGGDGKISRQRIAQYLNAIHRKFTNFLFEEIIDASNYQKIIESARDDAELTEEEDIIMSYSLGLDGHKIYEIEYIAENYEKLTRQHMPINLQTEGRVAFVREKWMEIKKKICRSLLFIN